MQPLIVSRQVVQGVKDFLRAAFSGPDMPVGADTAAGVLNDDHQPAGLPSSQLAGEPVLAAGRQPQPPETSFDGLIDRFIDTDGNLFRGPYLTLPLPFRPQHAPADGQPAFPWLPAGFVPHAHQGRPLNVSAAMMPAPPWWPRAPVRARPSVFFIPFWNTAVCSVPSAVRGSRPSSSTR